MRTRSYLTLTLLSFCLFFTVLSTIGCGGDSQKTTPAADSVSQKTSTASSKQDNQAATSEGYLSKMKFKGPDGTEPLVIKRYKDHDKLEINFGNQKAVLKARADKKNRVKYKEASADGSEKALIAKVKIKDDSFKLVNDAEALLWKVKIRDGKVKISDNEEGQNSCEIKMKSEDKGEIRNSSGTEIGNVRFYSDSQKLKVKNAEGNEILSAKEVPFSSAPGVILFEHIPVKHRMIIISEILRMGK